MEFQTHIISCVLNISTGMAHQPADSVCPTTELLSPTPVLPAAISGLLVSTRHRPSPPPLTQPVPCSVCESACQVLSLLSSPFLSAQGPSLHQNAIALSTDVLVPSSSPWHVVLPQTHCLLLVMLRRSCAHVAPQPRQQWLPSARRRSISLAGTGCLHNAAPPRFPVFLPFPRTLCLPT